MKTPRKTVAGGLALATMFTGFLALAAPASANANTVTGVASCQTDGTYTVTWTVKNDNKRTETATITDHRPAASTLSTNSLSIDGKASGTVVQTGIAGSSTSARLDVHGEWTNGEHEDDSKKVEFDGACHARLPVPDQPQPTPPTCQSDGVLVMPADTPLVHWTHTPSGTGPATYKLTATAASGYLFTDGATKETYTVVVLSKSTLDCNQAVVPVTPSVTEANCDHGTGDVSNPTLVLASTTGITYSKTGTVGAGNTVTVTATAKSGFKFNASDTPAGWTYVDSKHETWTHTFTDPTCDVWVTPAAPAFTDAQCTGDPGVEGNAAYVITAQSGVVYSKAPGTYSLAPGDSVTITATPTSGHSFNGAAATWTFTATVRDCQAAVTPVDPTVTQGTCDHSTGEISPPSIVPATTTGISYHVNGLVVMATPDKGYKLGTLPAGWSGDSTSATFTVAVDGPRCLIWVTPAAPAFTDAQCTGEPGVQGNASYVVTDQAGVLYSVEPGTYALAPGQSVTVTATPTKGHSFNEATDSWTFTAQVLDCRVGVSPAAPAVTQAVCDAPGHSTSPSVVPANTAGVVYTVSGDLGTVTAKLVTGYAWHAPLPEGWVLDEETHTARFAVTLTRPGDCLVSAVATAPTFSDNTCAVGGPAGASYTLPAVTGVDYTVDGTAKAAGSYPATDATTLAVAAVPQAGYVLAGTASWSHGFTATPVCAGVAGVSTNRPQSPSAAVAAAEATAPLADTGAPVLWLVVIGGALALVGAALSVGAADRRWFLR